LFGKGSRPALTDNDLKAALSAEITSSLGYLGGSLSEQRAENQSYYYGEPFGNEIEGRSQVVLRDVADTVEWIMPSLMRVFLASNAVNFDPFGPEDEEAASQATDYVNHVFYKDNPGFKILYDWFKDALIFKNGVVKVWWDDTEESKRHTFTGLDEQQLAVLVDEPNVDVVEQRSYPTLGGVEVAEDAILDPALPVMMAYDVTVIRTQPRNKVKIAVLPPEEFLISRRSTSIEDAPFTGHRYRITVSEGVQMGFDRETLLNHASDGGFGEFNEERIERFSNDEEYPTAAANIDESMREVWIVEGYMRIDYDGDGVAELRQIIAVGEESYEILSNEECDDIPFVDLTPIPVPHKWSGMGIPDLVKDIQLIRSTILRQLLDNMYLTNNNRTAVVENQVNLDDLLNNRPGGVVRQKAPGMIEPIVNQPLGPFAFPLLEFMSTVSEIRTGITRYNQGLDAETLNDTATGMARIMSAANQRLELYARIFAETGVRGLFKKILRLVVNNQDKARTIRLRNEWVPIDPRSWNSDMDMTVEVGLGYDSREQEMMAAQMMLATQEKAIQYQGGAQGPLVTLGNVHNTLKKLTKAVGFRDVDNFFADPDSPEMQQMMAMKAQQPPPPNPLVEIEMMKAQAKQQGDAMKAQQDAQEAAQRLAIEREKMAVDAQRSQREHELRMAEMQQQFALEREKIAAQMQIESAKIQAENAAAAQKLANEAQIARERLAVDIEMKAHESAERSKERAEQPPQSKEARESTPVVVNIGGKSKTVRVARQADGSMIGSVADDD